jgi:hypothetical protein
VGLNYGPCDFDQLNTGSVSFNYGLPFGSGKRLLGSTSGLLSRIIGGWQLGAVATLKSGLPFTPTIGSDRANTGAGGQRPNIIGTSFTPHNINCWFYTSANSSCRSLFPNGTDAFAVPAQYTIGGSVANSESGHANGARVAWSYAAIPKMVWINWRCATGSPLTTQRT